MLKVKFNYTNSQDGYEYRLFDDYEDFGYWFAKNFKNVIVWDIELTNE